MTLSNLIDMIEQAVRRHSARDAMMWKKDGQFRKLTYEELWKQIQSLAYGLQAFGVQADTKVAILSDNRPEWNIADLGTLALGAVSVPIYSTVTPAQVGFILQNADVEVVFVENAVQAQKVRQVAADPLRLIVAIEYFETDGRPDLIFYDDLLAMGADILQAEGPLQTWQGIQAQDLATIVHTSGTTGNPKGVMLTHENLRANVEAVLEYVPVYETDRSLSYLPFSHIFERTCGQFVILSSGACLSHAENIGTIPQNLLEVNPTLMTSVPRLFEKIYDGIHAQVRQGSAVKRFVFGMAKKIGIRHANAPTLLTKLLHPLFDKLVFATIREKMGGNLRLFVSGGGALGGHIADFFKAAGIPICEGYGLTETSPIVSTNPEGAIRTGTVGRPLKNMEVRIAEDGEVLVRGTSVMVGYYKNPEATAETFEEGGWLKTGDIGELSDGYLKIVERKKNILVLATGKNIAPFPIESAIASSAYVSQAILVGDKRKFASVLIVPDFTALKTWAEEQGLGTELPGLLAEPAVQELYRGEIDRTLEAFAPFERPKKFTLLPRELTLEDGELTPSLKVRTHVLLQQYREEIAAMYEETPV